MRIGIDISPISTDSSGHKVRGAGFYIVRLVDSLKKLKTPHEFVFFDNPEESQSCDIIHYPYFEPFFLSLHPPKQKKFVVTVHDLTPLVFPKLFPAGIKGIIRWQIQKRRLQNADAIITDSYSSKEDISKLTHISPEKIFSVPLAAGKEFSALSFQKKEKEELREKYHLPEKFILYVGDVTPNKNLPRFVSAVKKLSYPLVMVGKALVNQKYDPHNPWNKDLAEVQALTATDPQIVSVGFLPTEDLVKIYNTAEVFVFPSIYEGFGLPPLEAMACGCPVVTTEGGSLPEVVGDAALFVNPYDETSIKNGIEKVLSNKKLRETLSKKGIEQAKKFSWEKTARDTIAVYERIFQEKS